MNYTLNLQQYFDLAKIDYYSGSVRGLQELIRKNMGEIIPLYIIKDYLLYSDEKSCPKLLL